MSFLRRCVYWLSIGYVAGLVVATLMLRFVADHWWFTAIALYLPRVVLGLPLLLLTPMLLWLRMRPLLWTQAAAALIWLFPLMGLVLSLPGGGGGRPQLRVMSYNVDSGRNGLDALMTHLEEHAPDVVLLQEVLDTKALETALLTRYPHVHATTQFVTASRFPIRDAREVAHFMYEGKERTARAMHYEIDSPLGSIAFYSVHPMSPRDAFYNLRMFAFREQVYAGELLGPLVEPHTRANFEVRALQLAQTAKQAAKEKVPVIIAGDTNLPGLSPLLSRYFDAYTDGFQSAGFGFGYTYPTRFPWMRIDRIMASEELSFTSFHVDCGAESDHRCVLAELTR